MAVARYEGSILADTYQLEAPIGKGGMGVVYGARHTRLPRRFAIKILNPALAADNEQLQRFQSEAEMACSVAHNHVVEVFDFNRTDDGMAYIVMELLQGQDLAARILDEGRLSLRETAAILQQVADALEATHSRGIIHRDLKPPNLFLCRRDNQRDIVKVLDFGLAKLLQGQARTRAGMVFGTPAYMSPEQAMAAFAEVGVRTDVWALGVILYECLTGELPFAAKTANEMLQAICKQEPIALRAHCQDIPASVEAVVLKALRKRPEDRQQSVGGLRNEFSAACEAGWGHQVGSSLMVPQLGEANLIGTSPYVGDDEEDATVEDVAPAEAQARPQLVSATIDVLNPGSDPDVTKVRETKRDEVVRKEALAATVMDVSAADEPPGAALGAAAELGVALTQPQVVATAVRDTPHDVRPAAAVGELATIGGTGRSGKPRRARIVGGVVALLSAAVVVALVVADSLEPAQPSPEPAQAMPATNAAQLSEIDAATGSDLPTSTKAPDAQVEQALASEPDGGAAETPVVHLVPEKPAVSRDTGKTSRRKAAMAKKRAAVAERKRQLRLEKKQKEEKVWDPNSSGLPDS